MLVVVCMGQLGGFADSIRLSLLEIMDLSSHICHVETESSQILKRKEVKRSGAFLNSF